MDPCGLLSCCWQVAAHCITIAPCTVKGHFGPAEFSITLDLLKGGGWKVQTAALAFMCRAIDVVQPDAVGAEAIVAALVQALTAWHTWRLELAADSLLPMWLSSMHGCIEWLAAHFDGTSSELSELQMMACLVLRNRCLAILCTIAGDVLEPLVAPLAVTATDASVDTKWRASVCMLLEYIAPKSAAVQGEALRLVRGLHLSLPASAVLHEVIMHFTKQLGEKTLAGLMQELAALDISRPQVSCRFTDGPSVVRHELARSSPIDEHRARLSVLAPRKRVVSIWGVRARAPLNQHDCHLILAAIHLLH